MSFCDEVQRHCDELGILNPIQEADLKVTAVSFMVDGQWLRIEGTEMNRSGRLFFQIIYGGMNHSPKCLREMKLPITRAAEEYFSERWLDAETAGRRMLTAFKQASHFEVHWK